MAPPPWSSAAAANARTLWRAKRTAGYSVLWGASRQLNSCSVPCLSAVLVPAAPTRTKRGGLPGVSRQLSCAEQNRQRQEFQGSSYSSGELQQRQQEQTFLPAIRYVIPALCQPESLCYAPAPSEALCPPDGSRCMRRRLCSSKCLGLRTASTTVRPQSAAISLQNAIDNGRQPPKCRADGPKDDHGGATRFTNIAAKKKLENVMLLRRRSGGVSAGECLKALEAADGDIEAAAVHLRKQGLSRATSRRAAHSREGLVAVGIAEDPGKPGDAAPESGSRTSYTLVALTSETDFVAANARFVALAQEVARTAARAATVGAPASNSVTGTKQKSIRMSASTPDAEPASSSSVRADASASLLEAIKAAPVSESLLTLEPPRSAHAPRPAGMTGSSATDATAPQRVDGSALVDNSSTIEHDTTSDTKTISVSSALALLSQQFGEHVRLSDAKSVVVEQKSPRHDHSEYDSEKCSNVSNTAVGVYVHGQVAGGVGRAASIVCLRWHRDVSDFSSPNAAHAEQPATQFRYKIERLAQLLCMQVVATQPRYITLSDISESERSAERQILAAAAASSTRTRVQEGRMSTLLGKTAMQGECESSLAGDPAQESRSSCADSIVEARLEGILREQTLSEQEFLPLSRFRAEVLAFDGVNGCSVENRRDRDSNSSIPSSFNSSDINVPRVSTSAGTTSGKSTVVSTPITSRLTVKEALKQAAAALHCSTIEVESMQFLAVGQS